MRVSMMRLPGGRVVVPGNRWDLVPAAGIETRCPFVSVVIPYYDARDQLSLVLEGLALQDYPPDALEIIVVDDGSPEPLSLPDSDRRGVTLRTLHQDDKGFRAAAARNLGAAEARGEVLCFLDQDTIPEPGYLRAMVRLPAVLPDAVVVGRRRHADLDGWTTHGLRSWLQGLGPAPTLLEAPGWLADGYRESADLLHSDDTSYRYIISAVMSCTASLFRELGGFEESFTGYGGEDWELAFRAYNAGAVLAHEPAAVAWHDGPEWAGRGDDDSRRDDQARQRAELARRIPESASVAASRGKNGEPPADRPAGLILTWSNTSMLEPARLRATVAALLESPLQPAIYLDPGAVPHEVLARSLDLIQLQGDCDPQVSDLVRMRELLRSGTAGRVVLSRQDGAPDALITACSLRALRRSARWQPFAGETDLVEKLFGSVAWSS